MCTNIDSCKPFAFDLFIGSFYILNNGKAYETNKLKIKFELRVIGENLIVKNSETRNQKTYLSKMEYLKLCRLQIFRWLPSLILEHIKDSSLIILKNIGTEAFLLV